MGIFIDTNKPYPDGSDRYVARIHTDANQPRRKESRKLADVELFVVQFGGARNFHLRAKMSLETALAWYIQSLPEDLSYDTVERYRDNLERTLLGAMAPQTIMSEITDVHYREILGRLYSQGMDSYTCYQRFVLLRMFAVHAVVSGFTIVEPVSDILAGMDKTRPRTLINVPTKPHLTLIRSACGPRTRLVISLMSLEGMEVMELDRALRRDICFSSNTIFIRHNPSGHRDLGNAPGRIEPLSAQTRMDALRWMAISPGGPDDPLFTHNAPQDIIQWLTVAQRQVGLVRPGGKGKLLPLYKARHIPYYAARTRAEAGEDLLTLTDRFGYVDTASMHRRAGFIVENIAHAKHDRAIVRRASRAQ